MLTEERGGESGISRRAVAATQDQTYARFIRFVFG
jgi:hypothetical protein